MAKQSVGALIDSKYRVVELLGAGGSGSVYKAVQEDLNRTVAVKVLHAGDTLISENRARFQQEARLLAEIKHENIVGIYSFGFLEDDSPYMVMEYLEGETLAHALAREEQLDQKKTLLLAIQICKAMKTAHHIGIVHRDLKPQNIMLVERAGEKDFVKILDFGLSKVLSDQPSQVHTQTGALVGSPHYMSPEAAAGLKADQRSDIYSLACILYECLSGKPPFDADTPIGMLYQHRNQMPASLSKHLSNADLSQEFELIIFKCLQKDPAERFQTFDELLHALELLQAGSIEELNDRLSKVKFAKPAQEKALSLAWNNPILITGAILILAGAGYAFYQSSDQGKVTQAEQSLKARPTRDNQITWLAQSDALEAAGKLIYAKQIRDAVSESLTQNKLDLLNFYAEYAESRLKAGDKISASKWATYCLTELANDKSIRIDVHNEKLLSILNKSSYVILSSSSKMNKEQKNAMLSLLHSHQLDRGASSPDSIIHYYSLVVRFVKETGALHARDSGPTLETLNRYLIAKKKPKEALEFTLFCAHVWKSAYGPPQEALFYMRAMQLWSESNNKVAVRVLQEKLDELNKEHPEFLTDYRLLLEKAALEAKEDRILEAITYAKLAMKHADSLLAKIDSATQLCNLYNRAGMSRKAYELASTTMATLAQLDSEPFQSLTLRNTLTNAQSAALCTLGDTEKAASVDLNQIQFLLKQSSSEIVRGGLVQSYARLAGCYIQSGKIQKADELLNKAKTICKEDPPRQDYRNWLNYLELNSAYAARNTASFEKVLHELSSRPIEDCLAAGYETVLNPTFPELKTMNPEIHKEFFDWIAKAGNAALQSSPVYLPQAKNFIKLLFENQQYKTAAELACRAKLLATNKKDRDWLQQIERLSTNK